MRVNSFVLIGPSGCGKTTTLKMINRLIHLSEGYIYFKDKPISDYPVYENALGYWIRIAADCIIPTYDNQRKYCTSATNEKVERKNIDKRVDELLEMVGLEPEKYKNRKPDELSGDNDNV
ncbi:ATP-binding cassette domain-containing protein [Staphylococcus aureus]|nr:ATP-binding cassette domain-containing protein [Staphylococcus aureus]